MIKGNKTIYVICCNDALKYAVIGNSQKAELRLQALKDEEVEKKGYTVHRSGKAYNKSKFEEYENTHFWHIHEVEGE